MTSKFIQCCVSSCKSNIKNSHLFNIPEDVALRELWLKCLLPHYGKLGNGSKQDLIKEHVCHKHFEKKFLRDNGKTLFCGVPSLFTDKEILLGAPLGTEIEERMGDHTYSKPPNNMPSSAITFVTNLSNLKVNSTNKKNSELFDKKKDTAEEEIILLDHEELDELKIGPMAPLAPLVKKKQIVIKTVKCKTNSKTQKVSQPRTIEKGPFKCEYCSRWFQAKHLLNKHVRMHTNERPHVCEICNRGFNQLGTLIKHKQTHNNDRPFICNFCGKDFKYKWYFKEHLHTHDSNKRLICEVCSKTFATHSSLWMHIRTSHTVHNTCEICNENFPNYYKLQKHKATHANSSDYKCSICQSTYSTKSYLKLHLLRHKYE